MDRKEKRSALQMIANRQNLVFNGRWLNAAGTLGYAPAAEWPLPEPPAAFITNPISYRPRKPAADRAFLSTPGGFLLHTGWPCPGFREVLHLNAQRWARSQIPVWVHLLNDTLAHIEMMVRKLEETEGVQAIELSFPTGANSADVLSVIQAAAVELPVVLALPLDRVEAPWLAHALEMVSALSLVAPRGIGFRPDGTALGGRLYGPALLPLASAALAQLKPCGLPIIAGGGVMKPDEMDWLIDQGAAAVQLDFVLWRGWMGSTAH